MQKYNVDVDENMSVEEAAIMGSAQGVKRDYGAAESTTGSSDFLGKVEVFLKESFNFDDPMYLFSILVTCLVVVITLCKCFLNYILYIIAMPIDFCRCSCVSFEKKIL